MEKIMCNNEQVVNDINSIKIVPEKSLKELSEEFKDVMKKHGIKYSTKTENGHTCARGSWIVFKSYFSEKILLEMRLLDIVDESLFEAPFVEEKMKIDETLTKKESVLWEQIYELVSKIPRAKVEGDAPDAPSVATELENLFLREHTNFTKRTYLPAQKGGKL
jgi:hypothetical protein